MFRSVLAFIIVLPSAAAYAAGVDGGEAEASSLFDMNESEASYETTVSGRDDLPGGRASSTVHRSDIDRRLPRSAPEALRFESGVFVQQTAHAQGSAFVRGLTGQQTLLLFDGVRLNNSTYRQGPNQYFFTLDSQSLDSISVLRGGASTRYGSDAIGGVIAARPLEPPTYDGTTRAHGSLLLRGSTADGEHGGRVQVEAASSNGVGVIAGVGARRLGLLRSAGPVLNPANGLPADVPRFASDGRSQLGTGFDELTGDLRLTYAVAEEQRLTLAGYAYRQFDAPRTDQCPAPTARFDECLTYDEQFRTLVYGAWDGRFPALSTDVRATLSFQQQHERRRHERPASFVTSLGRDDVATFGVTLTARTERRELTGWLSLELEYGVDTYLDRVDSRSWLTFSDISVTVENGRGQYLRGSRYLYGGAFVEATASLPHSLFVRAGTRASWISAYAPEDAASGSAGIDQSWFPVVGHAGVEWRPLSRWSLRANLDRSFRAPNLDDLTSRQQTGPGFQFENAALQPELATTTEVGARVRGDVASAELWLFRTTLDGAVGKAPRAIEDCPPETPQCQSSNARFQLVNAGSTSEIRGVELAARARLGAGFGARATGAWTWGEGPNLAEQSAGAGRVPLSRIPPLNGTAELTWAHAIGLSAGGALRWAASQQRLAVADLSDARIPLGGTPGFAVFDLRMAFAWRADFRISAVVENVFDAPYRYHGSSVNGAGRSVVVALTYSPF